MPTPWPKPRQVKLDLRGFFSFDRREIPDEINLHIAS